MKKDPNVDYDKATQERFQAEQLLKETGSKEEYAAEIAPSLRPVTSIRSKKPRSLQQTEALTELRSTESVDEVMVAAPSRTIGYLAIIMAVASLFMWPTVLGFVAVVLGIIAWLKGNRALGAWSMILGVIAITTFFVLIPLYA